MQLLHLPQRLRILPLQRLESRDLLFDSCQFLLRLQSRIHLDDIPILSVLCVSTIESIKSAPAIAALSVPFAPLPAAWPAPASGFSARFIFVFARLIIFARLIGIRLIDRIWKVLCVLHLSNDYAHTAAPA